MDTRPAAKPAGRLSEALLRLLMKRATVVATERLAEKFRLITLEGAALRGAAWTAGQKIQIAMSSAFVARTYTPIDWDAGAGRTRILGYAHGDGPGSAWIRGLVPGTECHLYGPRRSVEVSAAAGPLAILGDETSIGLAGAILHQNRVPGAACVFEVDDVEASRRVTAHLGLDDAVLFGRTADGTQLLAMEAMLTPLAAAAIFVLTGKAATIQWLRQALKRRAVPATRIIAKAYWAPGKTGLD